MDRTEIIRDLITLLAMNEDHLCHELTSLAAKVGNFLDDKAMVLSGNLLSVMYTILTDENPDETVGIDVTDVPKIVSTSFS